MSYKLKLDLFEGPLDLLVYLIKKNDIDVKDIPIAEVTEQYMQYIELMKILDLDIVGDFLVMAATLMHIKSKMLLPPDPSEEEEIEADPRAELAKRLQEYMKFKEIADTLQEKESQRKDLFARVIDENIKKQLKEDAKEITIEANLFDLINAFSEALQRAPEEVIHEIVQEDFTVEDKIHDMLHLLLENDTIMLSDVFKNCRSKPEIVVSFLALLELIRLKEIKVLQKKQFSDIEIIRNKENIVQSEGEGKEEDNSDG